MKRFAFRLARVQRVRQIERDRAESEWARARAEQQAIAARVQDLRAQAAADVTGLVVGRVQSPTDIRATAFRASLRARAAELALVDLAAAEGATTERAATLLHASRRVDALERLETRHREAWTIDLRRSDSATMDDIATTRAARPDEGARR